MTKQCRKCGEVKPLDDFHINNNSKDGRQARCKVCAIEAARQWALDNPDRRRQSSKKHVASDAYKASRKARREGPAGDRIREQRRESYYRHREKDLARMRARNTDPKFQAEARDRRKKWNAKNPRGQFQIQLRVLYGLTLKDYDAMVLHQEGRCDICTNILDKPNVDHCHASGKVRALLCGHCNRGLGYFRDNPEALRKAAEYLEAHAA